ncbi:hypothetical protein FW774_05300 (plasmid) [Pedobacter sp. BS3]|uniref:hypothetical protein n=1 Tax=Pedobacter sp. BS3 TaxID=2567937 RepID=UPI0011EBFE6A|nr:hypothetical protein [Pedobacter sp. BS3]TZF86460.1 hypothetical protein FW774_05300 [Pedobacter sp. BS3]
MLRKDLISTEIQKLREALARILNLKKEGNIDDAHTQTRKVLNESFDIPEDYFSDSFSTADFEQTLQNSNLDAEKLNILSTLIFESAHPFEDTDETYHKLHAVLAIFNRLEQVYHQQSLDNLSKREMIDKFLNTDQYE